MRKREVAIIFLLLSFILAAMSIPLWWNSAQPYIFELPKRIEEIIMYIRDLIDLVLRSR